VTYFLEKSVDSNSTQYLENTIFQGGYFDYNLVSAFIFSDKSYTSPRMRDSQKHIVLRLKLVKFMLATYEQFPSKKQFPMDDLITYVVEMNANKKKEIRELA